MMTERERVIVLMSTIHTGYRTLKRKTNLGELPAIITLVQFTNFINKYEITAEELRRKLIPQRKIFQQINRNNGGAECNAFTILWNLNPTWKVFDHRQIDHKNPRFIRMDSETSYKSAR